MRGSIYKLLALALLAILIGTASCASNDLDDDDAADVVMEVTTLTSPSVTAQRQTSSSGTCQNSPGITCTPGGNECGDIDVCVIPQVCNLQIVDWTASISAKPKNPLATEPFNDIVLVDVVIQYTWTGTALYMAPFTVGLGNVTIPAGGSGTVMFSPVSLTAINASTEFQGKTADLTMTYRAKTVEGSEVVQVAYDQLNVEICN